MTRDTSEIPRGSKEFERKLNKAAANGVQDAIDRENARIGIELKEIKSLPTKTAAKEITAKTLRHPITSPMAHNSGAHNMRAGDHVIYAINGRTGVADEFLSDGEALITWDDGTHGIVNWYHLAPAPKAPVS